MALYCLLTQSSQLYECVCVCEQKQKPKENLYAEFFCAYTLMHLIVSFSLTATGIQMHIDAVLQCVRFLPLHNSNHVAANVCCSFLKRRSVILSLANEGGLCSNSIKIGEYDEKLDTLHSRQMHYPAVGYCCCCYNSKTMYLLCCKQFLITKTARNRNVSLHMKSALAGLQTALCAAFEYNGKNGITYITKGECNYAFE